MEIESSENAGVCFSLYGLSRLENRWFPLPAYSVKPRHGPLSLGEGEMGTRHSVAFFISFLSRTLQETCVGAEIRRAWGLARMS